MIDCVTVMTGGVGSRLWPASQPHYPKQFLPLGPTGESLLERTLQRAMALHPRLLLLLAPWEQLPLLRQACNRLPPEMVERLHLLLEPEGRNTAPALALAACWLAQRGQGEGRQLVLAADHLIDPLPRFIAAVEQALELAEQRLVVFGIPPSYPETGYGYIEKSSPIKRGFQVRRFIEKPDLARAQQLLATGDVLWNSGMFCYTPHLLLSQLRRYCPELPQALEEVRWAADDGLFPPAYLPGPQLRTVYPRLPKLSIDYALMERSEQVAVVQADFCWSDVGSWDALAELDHEGSLSVAHSGPVCQLEAHNNYVRTQQPVALCGVDDLIVVQAHGQLLICKRGCSQLVKQVQFPLS